MLRNLLLEKYWLITSKKKTHCVSSQKNTEKELIC